MGERRLEYLPIDELAPAAKNPKKHAIGLLADSLDQHGYTEPLLVDDRTGRLVAGHGRLEALQAAQAAGGEPPDGVTVADGRWLVPVVRGWASTDDYAASRYLVASNALVERGGWDDRALADLLAELGGNDPGLVGTGYGPDDLDELLARLQHDEPSPDGASDESAQLTTHWSVMIDCDTEAEQVALLDRLMGEGLTCRALIL